MPSRTITDLTKHRDPKQELEKKVIELIKQGHSRFYIKKKLKVAGETIISISNEFQIKKPLKFLTKVRVFNCFKNNPTKIFSANDFHSVPRGTIFRVLYELYFENKTEKISRGKYRLKKRSKK